VTEGALRVRALAAGYAAGPVLHDIAFDVGAARTLALVGPSGAGKSTLLRTLAGLLRPVRGEIAVGGRSIAGLVPQERHVAMVFAQDALARHLTIRANLALALRGSSAGARIEEIAAALEIERHLERRPAQLSTGERQRVSIARALLSDPAVLLLDEPLAPLDPELRARVREELVHVRARFGGPMLFVTHDHADAMTVADDLAVLIDGRIADVGAPQRVYDRPASTAVATFLGARPMNLIDGAALGESSPCVIGIRPEHMLLRADGPLRGTVERIERTGADAYVYVASDAARLVVRVEAALAPAPGTQVGVAFAPEAIRRFDRSSGAAIA
jgi:ABC-type sugar transport system ATPase subunit